MEDFQNYFLSLETSQQVYWIIAIIFSVIFSIQTILTLIGIDSVDGADADFDFSDGNTMDTGGALSLFSIRSLINFGIGLGWSGICFNSYIDNDFILGLVSIVIGILFGAMYPFIMKKLKRLESSGNIKIENCIDKEADVYLRIPAGGKGKVQISINGSVREYDAISEGEEISTGKRVKVIAAKNNTLTVTEL